MGYSNDDLLHIIYRSNSWKHIYRCCTLCRAEGTSEEFRSLLVLLHVWTTISIFSVVVVGGFGLILTFSCCLTLGWIWYHTQTCLELHIWAIFLSKFLVWPIVSFWVLLQLCVEHPNILRARQTCVELHIWAIFLSRYLVWPFVFFLGVVAMWNIQTGKFTSKANMGGASHMSKHMCTNQCSSRIHFVSVSKPRCLVHLTRGAVWCSIYCLSQDILASERSSTWCISYCKVILQKRFSAWLSAWSDLELWTASPLKLKTCSFCSDFVGCWNVWNFGFVPVFAFSPRCDRQRSVNRIGSGCDVLSFLMKRNRGPTFFSGEKNSHISFCRLFCWFIISKTIPCQKKKKT